MSYDRLKTAQAAAHLVSLGGGAMPYIKLLKLMYLAERLSYERYGFPITGDNIVSMDHGPVLSRTYDQIKGASPDADVWDAWIHDQANYMVSLTGMAKEVAGTRSYGDLSTSDLEVLDEVFGQYGDMDRWELVKFTHTLPEWKDPRGSSIPVEWETLFRSVGYSKEAASELEQRLRDHSRIDRQFA